MTTVTTVSLVRTAFDETLELQIENTKKNRMQKRAERREGEGRTDQHAHKIGGPLAWLTRSLITHPSSDHAFDSRHASKILVVSFRHVHFQESIVRQL